MPPIASSYHFRSTHDIEPTARRLVRGEAWLSGTTNGWTTLYDAYLDRLDPDEMHRVAEAASKDLDCTVFGLFASEDTLVYVLYDGGQRRDQYSTQPDRPDYQGQRDILLRYCLEGTAPEALEALLHGGPMPGSGLSDDHFEALRKRAQERLPADLANPEMVQKMLVTAAEQMKFIPPGMVETFFRSMGVPPNHPAVEAMRANPAEFIRQMAADQDMVRRFSQQVASGFGGAAPSVSLGPREKGTLLSRVLGIPSDQAMLTFTHIAATRPAGCRFLHR